MMHAGTIPSTPNNLTAEYARFSAIQLLEVPNHFQSGSGTVKFGKALCKDLDERAWRRRSHALHE
jgi:hypothetical protein